MTTAHTHKTLRLPAFFPDATYATIHSLPMYLIQRHIPGLVVTALHMKLLDLDSTLRTFAGFREFAGLPAELVLLSDSGGFQVFSLIKKRGMGRITDDGALFRMPDNPKAQVRLTPEDSQDIQHAIQSDIRVALDIPLEGEESYQAAAAQVETNTRWAWRAKQRFLELHGLSEAEFARTSPSPRDHRLAIGRPLLFAVVQGGSYPELRRESARQLAEIGFDGFGFGGWPVDAQGNLNTELLAAVAESVPQRSIAYGMGIGTPDDIARCYALGYTLFDCVLPTRNARHGYLYVSPGSAEAKGQRFDVLRITRQQYGDDRQPLDPACDCPCCAHYSRAYLRFLFKNRNPVAFTLATIHNLWWYQRFVERLGGAEGRFDG